MNNSDNKRSLVRFSTVISTQDIVKALIYLFTFFVVFTPVDVFSMKKITLLLLLVISIKYIRLVPADGLHRTVSLLGFWLTAISILISSIVTLDFVGNIVQGYMGLILLLFYLIERKEIDFSKIFENVLFLLAIFTVGMAILDIIGIIPMSSNGLLNWMSENGIAYVGKHSRLPTGYMIFVKTSPLLVILLPILYEKRRYIAVTIFLLALLISGTRANIIVGIVALVLTIILKNHKTLFEKLILGVAIIIVTILFFNGTFIDSIRTMFDIKAGDDAVRTGTLYSILKGFSDNPLSLLIGNGYTSSFYNEGIQSYSTIVELSYWNLLRQVGIFVFLPMMFVYLYPAVRLFKYKKTVPIAVSFVGYLFIAYTNPLLYSTTGLLGLLFMFEELRKTESEIEKNATP